MKNPLSSNERMTNGKRFPGYGLIIYKVKEPFDSRDLSSMSQI